jgi:predicted PurR-regulated permease PerM
MKKRKSKIIDRGFQLKTTFSILGIMIVAFLFIVAILGIDASIKNKETTRIINDLNKAIEVENNIVNAFIEYSQKASGTPIKIALSKIQNDHKTSINSIKTHTETLSRYERKKFFIISAIIGIVILLFIILYFYLITLTHRISGPLYVIENYMRDIIEGRNPDFRDLRDKDEFQNLYQTFKQMSEKIQRRKQ